MRVSNWHVPDLLEVVVNKSFELRVCDSRECERAGDFLDSIFREMGVAVLVVLDFFVVERYPFGFLGVDRECGGVIGIVDLDPAPASVSDGFLDEHGGAAGAVVQPCDNNGFRFRVEDGDTDTRCGCADEKAIAVGEPLVLKHGIAARVAFGVGVVADGAILSKPFCDDLGVATRRAEDVDIVISVDGIVDSIYSTGKDNGVFSRDGWVFPHLYGAFGWGCGVIEAL